MLDDTQNQPLKFRTKVLVEINGESHGRYNTNSQIKFKTMTIKSNLYDYSDAYILIKETISVPNKAAADITANNANKKIITKKCASITDCVSKINNTQVDNAKNIDVVMSMYNLIDHSDNYPKTSQSLCHRNEPALNDVDGITHFPDGNNSASFKYKPEITGETENYETKDIEIMLTLKSLNNFWGTVEMSLIYCEVNLILI